MLLLKLVNGQKDITRIVNRRCKIKVIIAGSRRLPLLGLNNFYDWYEVNREHRVYKILEECIKLSDFRITEVVSGTCWGIDQLGELWAKNNNIPILEHPADWSLGKSAGYIRNKEMSQVGEALICIQAEGSKGSTHMVEIMNKLKKPVYLKII